MSSIVDWPRASEDDDDYDVMWTLPVTPVQHSISGNRIPAISKTIPKFDLLTFLIRAAPRHSLLSYSSPSLSFLVSRLRTLSPTSTRRPPAQRACASFVHCLYYYYCTPGRDTHANRILSIAAPWTAPSTCTQSQA